MGKRAPRYNQKARSSSLPANALPHPNPRDVPEISEKSKKMSRKKKLRFDKFVEKQLKKENRVLLLEKLKEFKANDLFQSSKNLGRKQQVSRIADQKVEYSGKTSGLSKQVATYESSSSSEESHQVVSEDDSVDEQEEMELDDDFKESHKAEELDQQQMDKSMIESDQVEVVEENQNLKKDSDFSVHSENALEDVKPAFYVPVHRSDQISVARMSLPVVGEEQMIMETIMENDVTLLCSETGSGKTTQLPQFLYEAGFGHPDHSQFSGIIGITQPRRVAAVSMAYRVSHEMNLFNGEVSYQIRYDKGQLNSKTRIKFMTDGILLRELSHGGHSSSNSAGLLLTDYSCLIIDEAHERTVGTDILLGWLTRVVKLRNSGRIDGVKPLKLVIMSATLRVEDFTENKSLFPQAPPPVINIPGRQHKVLVHYNRHTNTDYLNEAFKKTVKIHSRLAQGGILIFVTGQHEVQILVRKLRAAFSSVEKLVEEECDEKNADQLTILEENHELSDDDYDLKSISEDDSDTRSVQSEEDEVQILSGTVEDEDIEIMPELEVKNRGPMHVLPLYSLLPKQGQLRIFEPPPEGSRLVVVATNIAETSLTIPGIKYVIDSGKSKERLYDPKTGLQRFCIDWTSKAAADQRAGRAGRVGPGHCYRLYSSAVFGNYFPEFAMPEISRVPLDGVILQMKAVGIQNILNFPFPTQPDLIQLKSSYQLLKHLDALDKDEKITDFGKRMAHFPISPRYAKMLMVASKQSRALFDFTVCMVSSLSVGNPFIHLDQGDDDEMEDEEKRQKRSSYYKTMQMFSGKTPQSDALKVLSAIGAYKCHTGKKEDFCTKHFLSFKAMEEIDKLICQIIKISHKVLDTPLESSFSKPPSETEQQHLLQILLTGNPDKIARLVSVEKGVGIYETIDSSHSWRIHPSSSLFQRTPSWIIYQESLTKNVCLSIDQESTLGAVSEKFYLNLVTAVEPSWITNLVPKSLLKSGKILDQPAPKYDAITDIITVFISPTYGPKSWPLSIQSRPLSSSDSEATLLIARFLLQGKLFPNFSWPRLRLNPSLLNSCRGLLLGKPFILNLLSCLHGLLNAKDFKRKWDNDPNWLYPQLLEWMHHEDRARFSAEWTEFKKKI